MKILVILSLIVCFYSPLQAETEKKDYSEIKKVTLESLDKRIKLLEEQKNCISKTTNAEGLKECRMASRKALKLLNKDRNLNKLNNKIDNLKDKKDKLESKDNE